jgi:hypothetical protein
MTKKVIGTGTLANDKKGDSLRTAFIKVNANFDELYIQNVPTTSQGSVGDVKGMMAVDEQYLYMCVLDYDDSTVIWKRIAWLDGSW